MILEVGLAAVLLAIALAGLALVSRPPERATTTIGGIGAVEVALAGGRVEIGESDRADVRLELTVRRRVGRARPTVSRAGDVLRVNGVNSEARLRLTLPRGTRARAEVRLGEITLWGSDGDLVLITDSGPIAGRDLGGSRFHARSRTGDITAHFTSEPDVVTAASDTGSVTLVVPGGPYAVDAATADPAAAAVAVGVDPTAPRRLTATSRSGGVLVAGVADGPVRI